MLETSTERVKLLKVGFPIKTIEHFYIKYNNFIIVDIPILTAKVGLDIPLDKTAHEMKLGEVYSNKEELILVV